MEAELLDAAPETFEGGSPLVGGLLAEGRRAYQLAVRILGSEEGAEDVVQQAYLNALAHPPRGLPPEEVQPWFLKVVANAARMHLRGETRRRRREAAVQPENLAAPAAAEPAGELVAALRVAVAALDEKYRLPLALCCEQGLSHHKAAAILDVPVSTISHRVGVGLSRLREHLNRSGCAAAPAAILGALSHTAPVVPASLVAALCKLAASATVPGAGATATAAAAKGGMYMKIIAGVVAAGVLAGTVAVVNGVGAGFKPAPTTLASPPAAAPAEGKPAPINPYNGMQEREEKFEFAQKPAVKKEGDKWLITFATTANCDATVAILDKDGKIIRHLASGVLGKNAPWPFQQNSLAQKVEWDGLTDTFEKAPGGCKVRVGLGLKAAFERNIAYDPNDLPNSADSVTQNQADKGKYLVAAGPDGNTYVLGMDSFGALQGRVFGKDGKYVRTFWPPAAADLEKVGKIGIKLATTKWGDKTPISPKKSTCFSTQGDMRKKPVTAAGKAMFDFVGIADFKEGPRPAEIPASKISGMTNAMFSKVPRMSVDRLSEELYAGSLGAIVRFSGKTGESDPSWKTPGKWGGPDVPWKRDGDTAVGPDGLIYARIGEHERYLQRTDRDGKLVPFKDAIYPADPKIVNDKYGGYVPPKGALISGSMGSGNTYMDGLDVAEDGTVLFDIHSWQVKDLSDPKQMRVAVADSNKTGTAAKDLGVDYLPEGENKAGTRRYFGGYFITVWTKDGKLITRDAVEGKGIGDGAYLDRDGNIYTVQGGAALAGQKNMYGITDYAGGWAGGGCLIKFRGQGGKYPVGKFYGKMGYYGDHGTPVPAGTETMKLTFGSSPLEASGAQWAFPVTNQSANDCNCPHARFYVDHWSRPWVPANQLCSVVVLDSNGNVIARLGKYGNADDTDADVKDKKDGLRFIWVRCVTASDTALYAMDYGSRRILKAALSYAAEESVPLP